MVAYCWFNTPGSCQWIVCVCYACSTLMDLVGGWMEVSMVASLWLSSKWNDVALSSFPVLFLVLQSGSIYWRGKVLHFEA
jgi:hypothetical protein